MTLVERGQELRMAANLSKEPVWVETFNSGGDLHKTVALAMVGGDEKKYSKELRKMAKGMNFSMLYLATAQSYVGSIFNGKPMNLVQATKMVNDYKKGLPTLMSWQKKIIDNAVKTGTIREYFGRPRRVRHLVNGGKKSQAARNSANMIIQGSCASILKITLLKLWKKGMISPNDELRFLNTVHDEINFSAKFNSESDLYDKLKSIKETMTFKLPEWPVVFEVDGSIGNSFGIQLEIKLENGRILPKLK